MTRRRVQRRHLATALWPAILIGALALSWLGTRHGLGVFPDSTQYLSVARSLLDGRGLVVHWWDAGYVPFTHFPPLYPLLLSAVARAGTSVIQAAAILNSLALVGILLLSASMVRRATGSTGASLAAAAFLAASPALHEVHVHVLSEPIFIFLTLGAIALLERDRDLRRFMLLPLAGLLAGLALLTRYAGIALIGVCLLVLVVDPRSAIRERLRRATAFAIPACLPVVLLGLYHASVGSSPANRELAFHPMPLWQFRTAAASVAEWAFPASADTIWAIVVSWALLAAIALFVVVSLRRGHAPATIRGVYEVPLIGLLALYVVAYVLFLLISITFVDAQTDLSPRILSPILPPVVIVGAYVIDLARRDARLRAVSTGLLGALALSATVAVAQWLERSRSDGRGYGATRWRSSPLVAAVRGLPPHVIVYSNRPDALLHLSSREAIGLPRRASPTSLRPNPRYLDQMRAICPADASQRVVIAVFTQENDWFLPSIAEVRRIVRSAPSLVVADGLLDTVSANCGSRLHAEYIRPLTSPLPGNAARSLRPARAADPSD